MVNIFVCLPQAKKCCCCFGLRFGCIIIGIINLLFVLTAVLSSEANKNYRECYNTGVVTKIIGYIAIFIAIYLFLSILYFLYGVIIRKSPTAVLWFMHTTFVVMVYNIVVSVLLMTQSKTKSKNCQPPYVFGTSTIISTLLLFYFLVILKSYHKILTMTKTQVKK